MNILAIETSSLVASAAIVSDDIMIAEDVQADEQGYIELYQWHFGEEQYKRLSGEERENMLKFVKRKF